MPSLPAGPCGPVVAPFTGAWIEILAIARDEKERESLPSRERGLKSERRHQKIRHVESLPSRERGLKSVALFAPEPPDGRSLHGSVD